MTQHHNIVYPICLKEETYTPKQSNTFCSLCLLSSFSARTVLASLDKVSLLMLLDCMPTESFKLGWTSVIVLKKSIPNTAHRSWTVLTKSSTLCSLSLCQRRQSQVHSYPLGHNKKNNLEIFSSDILTILNEWDGKTTNLFFLKFL